jgi:hypothetical protein
LAGLKMMAGTFADQRLFFKIDCSRERPKCTPNPPRLHHTATGIATFSLRILQLALTNVK